MACEEPEDGITRPRVQEAEADVGGAADAKQLALLEPLADRDHPIRRELERLASSSAGVSFSTARRSDTGQWIQ